MPDAWDSPDKDLSLNGSCDFNGDGMTFPGTIHAQDAAFPFPPWVNLARPYIPLL